MAKKTQKIYKLKSTNKPPIRHINGKRYTGWAGYSQKIKADTKAKKFQNEGNLAQVKKIGTYHWVLYYLKKESYKSWYSGKTISKKELLETDKILGNMEGEDREFLMDGFPKSKRPRKKPFIHKSNLGYDVLNISKEDIKKAKKKVDW
ncbi:hypothetical protein LCGC14_1824920 [marine sediment metagenome]|uniref:Uncharacterized protein n=1 Tax=marine sediment metagenome TaxID=412755 RepID=A0A0F9IXG1_9ZZZZ